MWTFANKKVCWLYNFLLLSSLHRPATRPSRQSECGTGRHYWAKLVCSHRRGPRERASLPLHFFFFFFYYSTGELREGWLVLSTNCWSDTVKLISISRTVRRARAGVSERTSRPCCISVSLFFYIFFLISISLLPLGKAIARYICKLFSVEATRAVGLVYSFYLSFGFSGVATDFRSKPHTQRLWDFLEFRNSSLSTRARAIYRDGR